MEKKIYEVGITKEEFIEFLQKNNYKLVNTENDNNSEYDVFEYDDEHLGYPQDWFYRYRITICTNKIPLIPNHEHFIIKDNYISKTPIKLPNGDITLNYKNDWSEYLCNMILDTSGHFPNVCMVIKEDRKVIAFNKEK